MARVCQVTGATPGFGNTISHSHRRSKRRFNLNVQKKTYWVPSLGRKVTLTVSARGIMTIDLYKQVIEMFRGGQPYIHDPFEERDVKVVFGSLAYDGTSEEFTFELFEDKD